jgi:hypothetical protein
VVTEEGLRACLPRSPFIEASPFAPFSLIFLLDSSLLSFFSSATYSSLLSCLRAISIESDKSFFFVRDNFA